MSRRWLLSLLCLSFVLLCLVPLTRAGGEVRVNEANTRILLEKDPLEVLLAVENSSGEPLNARVELKLLDPKNNSRANTTQVQSLKNGSQTLSLFVPLSFSSLSEKERRELVWLRLHYRISKDDSTTLTEGIISFSEITRDLFDIRVATSEIVREGGVYRIRVHASHPITRLPVANVRVDGVITLEADGNKSVKLQASKITDSKGYAILDFTIPQRFPEFPHSTRPAGGEFVVTARRGSVVVNVKAEVLVDQFARMLVTSDKPMYQPGQVMHLRTVALTPSKRALAHQNIFFRITDPEDQTLFRTVVKTSRFGVANAEWPIPENARLGYYRVFVGVDGSEEHTHSSYDVRISRYDLPNFSVSLETDRTFYLPGQDAEVKVRADYLFGQPVTRGYVRVVRESEREWNYREQKWDIEEGDKYEGETDAKGVFVARIKLEDAHDDLKDSGYQRFRDVTYAAYFTDPTTNRTEQRRFDLRVTKESIHVYVLLEDYGWNYNRKLPLKFYVSTFYADGSPARCKVKVKLADPYDDSVTKSLAAVRTNRYGLVKFTNVRLPRDLGDESKIDLVISAADSHGAKGSWTDDISFNESRKIVVETDKALYRAGEPITAVVTSSVPDDTVVVDLARDSNVIRSERLRLRDGRASITFPYRPEFKNELAIAAYPDFPESNDEVGTCSVLYPNDNELKVNVRTSQVSYRPGDDAQVDLSVRAAQGGATESALGVVVLDRAVEERFRTDEEFGRRYYRHNNSISNFLGEDEQLAGVTFRDLQRLDMSKPVSPELDLLASILLNQSRDYYPHFYGGDQYELQQAEVFGASIRVQLQPLRDALAAHYKRTAEYPKDDASLRRLLSELRIDLDTIRDPWGMPYRPVFNVDKQFDVLNLESAGADKRFDTGDDIFASQQGWPYFQPVGESIDKAVRNYHDRTGGFIRDLTTLNAELLKNGVVLGQIKDRWGEPYRLNFDVAGSTYVIRVRSGGPDKHSPTDYEDDFIIWTSPIDYFDKQRAQIDLELTRYLNSTGKFPRDDGDLREALPNLEELLRSLRDPWNRSYYRVFKTESSYADRVVVDNRSEYGSSKSNTVITPVTRLTASVILRSVGPDGQAATVDDFNVATFSGVLSEQERGQPAPQPVTAGVVFSGTGGAIYGVVTDTNGAVIPGTTITATKINDGQVYHGSTNTEGNYTIADLPHGVYELRFVAAGFKITLITNVVVRASNLTQVNATLDVGASQETVTVTAGAATQLDTTVSAKAVSDLPINRKNLRHFAGAQQISTPRLREYFPETLLWQPSIETDKNGRAQIKFKLADNITTWKMTVIGSTEDGRIGTTETEIRAFQPFFVEHDPPRVLTEGDEISLPVVVRNYLDRAQKVDLEIKPESWFALLGPARKRTDVAAGEATRETFDFRAVASLKDGKQRITANGGDGNDAIEKPITVHPDGEEVSATAADIVSDSAVLELNVPETMIPNSSRAELKIYPNLMAHVIESIEAIMSRPYACAEQTISAVYPGLILLRHYKKSGEDFALRRRAERYLDDGYSRLLNYRDESGGFSYWNRSDPDIALTAYAVRFLTDASDVIPVDQEVIKQARDWLIKQQRADGSWQSVYWAPTEGDEHRNAVLTAYVARVLSRNANLAAADSLKRALSYLGRKGITLDEPYLLASYALAAMDAEDAARAAPLIARLRGLALTEGTTTYWALETNTPFWGWGLAGRVETTAVVVQALSRYCDSQGAECETDRKLINRALLFLLKKKDRFGVWYSTQATINVLDALLTMFSKNSGNSGTSVDVLVNGRPVRTLQMPAANQLSSPITLDISEFVRVGKNAVELKQPAGSPFASVQAVANYYVPWSAPVAAHHAGNLRLVAKFDKTEGKINEEITCNVEAERIGFRGYGMLLVEIGVPPGADVDRSSLNHAMESSNWAISQYDVLPDRVVVYLWPRGGGVKFNFKFRPRFALNAKTAASVVYDYYNPEARAVVAPATFRIK